MIENSSIALISVWQIAGLLLNGPTLSSLLGTVSLNCCPDCAVKAKSITAGSEGIWEQGIPKVPASPLNGLILGEIRAYIA